MGNEKNSVPNRPLDVIMSLFYRFIFYCVVLIIFIGDNIVYSVKFVFDAVAAVSTAVYEFFSISLYLLKWLYVHVLVAIESIVKFIQSVVKRVFRGITGIGHSLFKKRAQSTKDIVKKIEIEQHVLLSDDHDDDVIELTSGKKERTTFGAFLRQAKYFAFGILTALLLIGFGRVYSFVEDLPNPRLIGNVNYPVSTQIYDRNGNLLYDVFRDEDRTPIELEALPEYVIQATLSIEDRNFYNHNGISVIGGILRAVKDTYLTGELQGGSTITQQLVKSSLLTPERTIERKIREAIIALWAERIYTKSEILEMYLNQVAYGGTAYGIEEAAKTFFNKSATELTLNEAAFLAGLTRAPSTYSPYLNPQLSIERRDEVLLSMLESGYINEQQYREELQKKLDIEPPKIFIRAPHFVFYVKALLEERYGIRRVEEGGLRVVTTLDIDLQEEVEDILAEEIDKVQNLNVTNGAVLVTSPSTGEILAMAGSKDYFAEPYGAFNVTTAERQPGSSIKPLVYSLGIESGKFTASSIIQDTPVVYDIPGSRPYRPVNYDNRFHGAVPLRYALANSYNIPAVKVLNELGVENFINYAESLGITTWDTPERYGLSLALGGAEVKMTDMAVAFGVFANYGTKVDLNPILSVEDFKGDTLETFKVSATPDVLSEETSFIMSDILSDNEARKFAFGPTSDLYIPGYKVAAKTGTTNDKRDNWTNGFTRKFFVGVWVGNNDNTPMNPILTSGVTGASPIWNRVMTRVLQKDIPVTGDVQPPSAFNIPSGVVASQCYFGKTEYYKLGTQSGDSCGSRIFGTTPSPGVNVNFTISPTTQIPLPQTRQ